MFDNVNIDRIYASDVDGSMVEYAKRNLGLLSHSGLAKRRQEIKRLYEMYGKQSHLDALRSCDNLYDNI